MSSRPAPTAARPSRFRDLEPAVKRGYFVWSGVGLVIAIPEIWAAFGKSRWPTISGTVGHLESLWDGVPVIVVALIVGVAANAVILRKVSSGEVVRQADGAKLGRTAGGRLTTDPETYRELPPLAYFPVALVLLIVGSILAATLSDDEWILGYVIYGLIAALFLIIPSLLAYDRRTPDAPFSSLFRTIADLQSRSHLVSIVILAGLVVLLIHLAFYPWPDVFRHNPTPDSP